MRHIDKPKRSTQFIIFNLFGDYISVHADAVWTSKLLQVLKVLGVSERAARSTLSRMKRNGWLHAMRRGRLSMYALTSKGRNLLDQGRQRLFGPRPGDWDGCWSLVTYSLPQEMRSLRHQLRTRLSWLGFGMLEPGTMISAHPQEEEVLNLIHELNVDEFVHFFTSARLDLPQPGRIVNRCWDLDALNNKYVKFIERHEKDYLRFKQIWKEGGEILCDDAFVHRFWATYEYSAFPRQDPNLPPSLLPPSWRGDEAINLLARYREILREPAENFIGQTLDIETNFGEGMDIPEEILVR
jgi:phenylacetic acid degradation operon negative regulatory protein